MCDVAKGAGACAAITQDQECGGASGEALGDIGTLGLYTDSVGTILAQDRRSMVDQFRCRGFDLRFQIHL